MKRVHRSAQTIVIGACVAGSMIGVFAACSGANPGNLCGLHGVFGAGPLATGIALFAHGVWWNRRVPQ